MRNTLMTLLCIAITGGGNLLLKRGIAATGGIEAGHQILQSLARVFVSPWIIAGLLCYVFGTVLWLQLLSIMELSYVYPFFVGGAFLLVTVVSALVFHEHVTGLRIAGIMVVAIGIAIVTLGR